MQQRYKVQCKLGYGFFSTVWLAKDISLGHFVAVKIAKPEPAFVKTALDEINLLKRVQQKQQEQGGPAYMVTLLDHFSHEADERHGGRNHMVLVFELLGPSLLTLMKQYRFHGLPVKWVQRITHQLLEALDFLHRQCGIVHTDLKPENILITVPDPAAYIQRMLIMMDDDTNFSNASSVSASSCSTALTTVDEPFSPKLDLNLVVDTVESYCPEQKCPLDDWQELDVQIRVIDLGNACRLDDKELGRHLIQTRQYRSPEVILGVDWDQTADLWSLGCLIYEMITGTFLFDPQAGPDFSKDDDHLAGMIELLRVVPRNLMQGRYSRDFFNLKKELHRVKTLKQRRLRDVLHDTYMLPAEQADGWSSMLLRMLEMDQNKRSSALSLLSHPWLSRPL
ncbi:kinase-like protein [Hesseltinella vesiculosa]|uniref:non-specific serine/threonine protein kinase n=1 Tax=Hesseltinella vesiculosa TaxID=101127 RepID=A0A1X2GTL5_9FUNG|nr:kinase-like protein [Hesseltinella vesiculosa]